MNLAAILEASARVFPERAAVVSQGKEYSYAYLNHRADLAAAALTKLGLRPGERVGLCLPASVDWPALYFGIMKAGGTALTLFHNLTARELAQLVADGTPSFLFLEGGRLSDLGDRSSRPYLRTVVAGDGDLDWKGFWGMNVSGRVMVDRERDDPAAILYTGGSTGAPKGVILSHANILSSAHNVAWAERSTERDRALCFLPLNHVFGQIHIMASTILTAGALVLLPGFDLDRVLGSLADFGVTKFYAVPTVYVRLLELGDLGKKLAGVSYTFSAAASMAREVVNEWKTRTGLSIHEAYGMTETASMVTYNHFHRHVVGSVGTPAGTVEVAIMDPEGRKVEIGQEGEICVRGPNVMTGYLNKPGETRAAFRAGWLRSGDVGLLDEKNYLFIVDRLKDMIITGGENVYPREIEEILHEQPEILECSVVGVPDREYGEKVTAVVVLKPGATLDPARLKAVLRGRLSPYKTPREFIVVDELPKSPTGKILKREIRQDLAAGKK
ncbi:MAG: AMP-binding protein [Pseudomonadota bacterium]